MNDADETGHAPELNDPGSTDPADLITDLYAPLAPKSVVPKLRRSLNPT
jgi:hypothetical protein